jgi:hypothetical protein
MHLCQIAVPCPVGLGVTATAAKFAEVMGLTWAGSQVTKVQIKHVLASPYRRHKSHTVRCTEPAVAGCSWSGSGNPILHKC